MNVAENKVNTVGKSMKACRLSAYSNLMLDIDLSSRSSFDPILGYSHSAVTTYPENIVVLPSVRGCSTLRSTIRGIHKAFR